MRLAAKVMGRQIGMKHASTLAALMVCGLSSASSSAAVVVQNDSGKAEVADVISLAVDPAVEIDMDPNAFAFIELPSP